MKEPFAMSAPRHAPPVRSTYGCSDEYLCITVLRGQCALMPLRELIDCAEERLTGDELVDVAIRSPEVLPGRSWFA